MNDPQNMPVEPCDDGTIQEDPLYQAPSEGIVTHVDENDSRSDERDSHGDRGDHHPVGV